MSLVAFYMPLPNSDLIHLQYNFDNIFVHHISIRNRSKRKVYSIIPLKHDLISEFIIYSKERK